MSDGLGSIEVTEAGVHQAMATIYARQGEPEAALASQRLAHAQAEDKAEKLVDPKARWWFDIGADHGLGRALAAAGEHEEALRVFEQASKGFVERGGSASWRRQAVEVDTGISLLALGRAEEARARLRPVVALIEARTGPEGLELQKALVALARAELEAGDVALAREHVERALGLLEARAEPVPDVEATARFVLARCLFASPGDRSRALALARRAERALVAEGPAGERELGRVRTWLAEHGGRGSRQRAAVAG